MKIYNKENNQEKVYVLKEALAEVKEVYESIPSFINERLERETTEYISFTEEKALNYFKTIFWLIDFKEYAKYDFATLKKLFAEEYAKSQESKTDLVTKKELLYKCKSIQYIIDYRLGRKNLNLPLVPNSDSVYLETASNNPKYAITQALDPNMLLLYNKSGAKLSYFDNIPSSLIDSAVNLVAPTRRDPGTNIGNTLNQRFFSDDFQYYIIESKFREYPDPHEYMLKKTK